MSDQPIQPSRFSPPTQSTTRGTLGKWLGVFVVSITLLLAISVVLFLIFASSLRVQILPTDAEPQVQLSGGFAVKLGDRFLLLPGEYIAHISAHGFVSREEIIQVNAGAGTEVAFTLAPLPGLLQIKVDPVFAQTIVTVDSVPYGPLSEMILPSVEAGVHQVTADANLYRYWSTEIDIEGRLNTQTLNIELTPAWAWIDISTQPEGAQIDVIGGVSGESPTRLQVEEGPQRLTVNLPGYQSQFVDIQVVKDQSQTLDVIELKPLDAELQLISHPVGASVTLDGQFVGQTPLSIGVSPDQPHQITLFKSGFEVFNQTIEIPFGETQSRTLRLQPSLATITLYTSEPDTEIWVDGQLAGVDLNSLTLPTVPHTIEARKPGYETERREILPNRTSPQHLTFNLLTHDEARWASIPSRYQASAGQTFVLFKELGEVTVGSSRGEAGRRSNETRWSANLDRPFYVSTHEITNEQYKLYDENHSSGNFQGHSFDTDSQPVVGISWQNAALYANWLSVRDGLEPFYTTERGFVSGYNDGSTGYRLLTEAEWQWLAVQTPGGVNRVYPWGDESTPQSIENFAGTETADILTFSLDAVTDNYVVTAPVGRFPANSRGLFDLGGNVSEWVNDWYQPTPYAADEFPTDPKGPEIGEFHVIRGASWKRGYLPQLRLAYRDYQAKGRDDVGFRLARYAF